MDPPGPPTGLAVASNLAVAQSPAPTPGPISAETAGVNGLVCDVDAFLTRKMPMNEKSADEIKAFRENKCLNITVQGQTVEKISLKDLETRLPEDVKNGRTTIPSHDILPEHPKLPLHVTSQDVLEEITKRYKNMSDPKKKQILDDENKLDHELQMFDQKKQTLDEAVRKISDIFESTVILPSPRKHVIKKKLEREIESALKQTSQSQASTVGDPNQNLRPPSQAKKDDILDCLHGILHEGVEISVLAEPSIKAKYGALVNRRGSKAEHRITAAINQVLERFVGMTVMGIKTHTYLREFLDLMNIKLSHQNTYSVTGKQMTAGEVEIDILSTWLEQDSLVFTLIESKTGDVKPWVAGRRGAGKSAVKHAVEGLNQCKKDFVTVKEIFPDISEEDWGNIR